MKENLLDKHPHLIPAVAAALMLFVPLGQWPYGKLTGNTWADTALQV